jgi:hypothetical protein
MSDRNTEHTTNRPKIYAKETKPSTEIYEITMRKKKKKDKLMNMLSGSLLISMRKAAK